MSAALLIDFGSTCTKRRAPVGGAQPRGVLRMALADPAEPLALKPRSPRLLLDREYLLYACGLLQSVEPQPALELALQHLAALDQEIVHERTGHA